MSKKRKEMLPVRLTESEAKHKAEDMAAKVRELEEIENHHKDEKRKMKEKEEEHKIRVRKLAREIASGEEDRLVDVYDVPSLGERQVHTYRDDTGELVRSRPMTAAEEQDAQQERLPGLGVQ